MTQNRKLVFFGSTDFSVIVLDELKNAGYIPSLIVCSPDKKSGRGKILTQPPTKIWGEKNKVEVLQPVSLKNPKSEFLNPKQILNSKLEIGVIASYGKIIPKEILDLFSKGVLNIHPSMLPKYRGPSPIQTIILNGDSETGVTIMLTDEQMDHGPLLAQREYLISKSEFLNKPKAPMTKINYYELHDELARLGGKLLAETLPKWIAGEITPTPQNHSKATFTKIFKKEDGHIDWSKSAKEIERQIRAFIKWPTSYTFLQYNNKKIRLIITSSRINPIGPIGLIRHIGGIFKQNAEMAVVCGRGVLVIERLIPEGKKEMSGEEFLRGNGDILNSTLS